MAIVISFINEKGGVGKTTSVLEFASQLGAGFNKRVLVVDIDGQANASTMLLGKPATLSVADLLLGSAGIGLQDCIIPARDAWRNCAVLPADKRLSGIEAQLSAKLQRETLLQKILRPVSDVFDFILIDLPPALNLLTVNALVASTHYLIPSDTSDYALAGIRSVETLVKILRTSELNPNLQFLGVLITSFQKGVALSVRSFLKSLQDEFPENPLLGQCVPHSTKVVDSQQLRTPLSNLLPDSPVAIAYRNATERILVTV